MYGCIPSQSAVVCKNAAARGAGPEVTKLSNLLGWPANACSNISVPRDRFRAKCPQSNSLEDEDFP